MCNLKNERTSKASTNAAKFKTLLEPLPPLSIFLENMSTSQREPSPFYVLEPDKDSGQAYSTTASINCLLDLVNQATAEFYAADCICIKWYCVTNSNLQPTDCFKLLLAAAIPLYGQVFSFHNMDSFVPNYWSDAITACYEAVAAFCIRGLRPFHLPDSHSCTPHSPPPLPLSCSNRRPQGR